MKENFILESICKAHLGLVIKVGLTSHT